jgi:hypothetical protein
MKITMLAAALALLVGCNEQPGEAMPGSGTRFRAVYQSTFTAAGLDRADRRSIYVITDTKTGVEYLAVEGCGTAQLVTEGKYTVER